MHFVMLILVQGSDARDASLGRAFGYTALIRSGRPSQDFQLAEKLAQSLLILLRSKSFLAEVSAAALLDLLEQLDNQSFKSLLLAEKSLQDLLQSPADSATPEVVLSTFPETCAFVMLHTQWSKLAGGFVSGGLSIANQLTAQQNACFQKS